MPHKKILLGFIIGFITAIALVVSIVIYTTSKILPTLEKEGNQMVQISDKPVIRITGSLFINELRSIDDSTNQKKINLKQNKVIIINFWATWCKPCIEEMNSFVSLIAKVDTSKINYYFLSSESTEKQHKFVKSKKWTSLPFYNFTPRANDFFKPRKWPTTLIIKNQVIYLIYERSYKWDSDDAISFIRGLQ